MARVLDDRDTQHPDPLTLSVRRLRAGDLRPAVHVAAVAAFAFLPLQGLRIGTSTTYSDVALVVAAGLAVLSPHRRYPAENWPGRLLALGLGAMAVGGVVALAFTDTPFTSAGLLLRLAGVVVLALALWRAWDPPLDQILGLFTAFVAASVASAVAGILASGLGLTVLDRYQSDVGRATGFAGNSNLFGVVSVIGIGLALVLATESRRRTGRWIFGVAAGLQFVGVLYSGSRGAVVGAVAVGALVGYRLARRGQGRVVVAAVAVATVVALSGLLGIVDVPAVDRFALRDDAATASDSGESALLRLEQIPKRLDQRGYHSLTVGSGLRPTGFHNTHLDFWTALGIVGAVGWVLVCVATVAPAVRLVGRRDPLSEREVLTLATGLAFLGFAVTALTLDNTWNRYVWLLIGLVPHLRRAPARFVPAPPVSERAKRRIVTLLAASGVFLAFFNIGVGDWARVADVAFVGAAGLAVLWGPFGGTPATIISPRLRIGGALLLAGGLLGLLFSEHVVESAALLARVVTAAVLAFVLVGWWAPRVLEVRRLLLAFVAGIGVTAGFGAFASIVGLGFLDAGRNEIGRAVGLTGNANHLGFAAAMGFAVSLVYAVERPRSILRPLWYGGMAVATAGLLWSGSRGALFGVLAVLVLTGVRLLRVGRSRAVLGGVAVGIAFAIVALTVFRIPAVDRLLLRTDTEASAHSVDSTRIRGDLFVDRLERPGYWSLLVGSGMERRTITAGHSTHLELWVGTGLVGFAGWVLICWATAEPTVRLIGRRRPLDDGEVALLAVGQAFVTYLIVGFVDEHIWDRFVWLLIALTAYLCSPVARRRQSDLAGDVPAAPAPDPDRRRGAD